MGIVGMIGVVRRCDVGSPVKLPTGKIPIRAVLVVERDAVAGVPLHAA